MRYIVHKRFKGKAICGEVNIPAMSVCECIGDFITYNNKTICYATSKAAHQHFAIDEDGMGMVRGKLTQAIQKTLANRDKQYQERWDKVWDDHVCQQFKRKDHEDFWLWNHDFFNADINVLRHIANLIGVKEDA